MSIHVPPTTVGSQTFRIGVHVKIAAASFTACQLADLPSSVPMAGDTRNTYHVDQPAGNEARDDVGRDFNALDAESSRVIEQDRKFRHCDRKWVHDFKNVETFVEDEHRGRASDLGMFAKAVFYHCGKCEQQQLMEGT
jgi:hypothetical protein